MKEIFKNGASLFLKTIVINIGTDDGVKENMTVIIITHNAAIAPMADKVIRFKSGRVLETTLNEMPIPVEEIEW